MVAQERGATPERLQDLLQRFPAADANRDGTLTEAEAATYAAQRRARKSAKGADASGVLVPPPTDLDIAYGSHARNTLDFWRAKSDAPTPVVVYIHGGGFVTGDKSGIRRDAFVHDCLAAGVSFAAINYRYLAPDAPLQEVLRDCARGVQFIRSKAAEWNIDKARIAAYGGSAGAGTSLWLAFHDDLADPESADPVRRESTRLTCVGSNQGQFSYDFLKWRDVFGADAIERFGGRYRDPRNYGLATVEEQNSAEGQKIRADCDMLGLVTKDDPPVFINSTLPTLALENTNHFLHHPKHSYLVYQRLRELGVPVVATIPAMKIAPPKDGPANLREFMFSHLDVKDSGTRAQ